MQSLTIMNKGGESNFAYKMGGKVKKNIKLLRAQRIKASHHFFKKENCVPFLNLELIFCKSPIRVVASNAVLLGLGSRIFPELELT